MIKNRKYTKNKKNKGNVPNLPDRRVEYVPTKCGNCMECRRQKANEWRVRLLEHIKTTQHGKFITLTLSNESIKELYTHQITRTDKESGTIQKIPISTLTGYDRDNQIATRATRLFNERWRKKYGKAIQHWLITELGHNGTENIHLHGIVWTPEHIDNVREIWNYGWIWPKPWTKQRTYVNNRTITYMMKYVTKIDFKHKEYKPIILCSPGIGKQYTATSAAEKNVKENKLTYRTSTGHEIALPTYWTKKLFTEEDREEIWLQRLNKEERWVDGIRYDISKTQSNYERAVKDARRKNKELGYGGRKNENRKQYEEQRREIMIQTRIQKRGVSPR